MRKGVTVELNTEDRQRLVAIVADRNSPQKHVWRAQIVLLTADGCGTAEIMRRTDTSKTAVWRWQERFMTDGVPRFDARQDAPVTHPTTQHRGRATCRRPHAGGLPIEDF